MSHVRMLPLVFSVIIIVVTADVHAATWLIFDMVQHVATKLFGCALALFLLLCCCAADT